MYMYVCVYIYIYVYLYKRCCATWYGDKGSVNTAIVSDRVFVARPRWS